MSGDDTTKTHPRDQPALKVGDRVWLLTRGFGEVARIGAGDGARQEAPGFALVVWSDGGSGMCEIAELVPLLTLGDTCDEPPHPGRYRDSNGDILDVYATEAEVPEEPAAHHHDGPYSIEGMGGAWTYEPYTYLGPLDAEQVEAEAKTHAEPEETDGRKWSDAAIARAIRIHAERTEEDGDKIGALAVWHLFAAFVSGEVTRG